MWMETHLESQHVQYQDPEAAKRIINFIAFPTVTSQNAFWCLKKAGGNQSRLHVSLAN